VKGKVVSRKARKKRRKEEKVNMQGIEGRAKSKIQVQSEREYSIIE
jgi:hypothetical protein